LEFAKRFYLGPNDCSPISIKEVMQLSALSPSLELVRKYQLSLSQFLFLRNFGFRSVSRSNRKVTALRGKLLSNTLYYLLMIKDYNVSSLEDKTLLSTIRNSIKES
jgi:hypothetical protein